MYPVQTGHPKHCQGDPAVDHLNPSRWSQCFFCLIDFTNQINVTLNLLKKSLPLIIQHEALICQNLSFISIYCTSIWSCSNVIWRFRGVEDKNNDWLWQFRWIDILINHRTKSAAITYSFNLCTILNLVNKLNPKKGCSPILFLPMNEREWKCTEKADMRFSIFTVLLYVF